MKYDGSNEVLGVSVPRRGALTPEIVPCSKVEIGDRAWTGRTVKDSTPRLDLKAEFQIVYFRCTSQVVGAQVGVYSKFIPGVLSLRLAANDHASRGGFQGSSGIASMYIT